MVAGLLGSCRIIPAIKARDKKQLLKKLAEIVGNESGLPARLIYHTLVVRENACGTGMGGGVAIPHARFTALNRFHVYFTRMDKPVDFEAPDDQPVDLIFLLLSPLNEDTGHLKALSSITRLLRNKECKAALRAAKTEEELYMLIAGKE